VDLRETQDIHKGENNVDKSGEQRIMGICEILFLFCRFIGRPSGRIQVKSSTFLQKERGDEALIKKEKLTDIGF
jgi:hypothetical protein